MIGAVSCVSGKAEIPTSLSFNFARSSSFRPAAVATSFAVIMFTSALAGVRCISSINFCAIGDKPSAIALLIILSNGGVAGGGVWLSSPYIGMRGGGVGFGRARYAVGDEIGLKRSIGGRCRLTAGFCGAVATKSTIP